MSIIGIRTTERYISTNGSRCQSTASSVTYLEPVAKGLAARALGCKKKGGREEGPSYNKLVLRRCPHYHNGKV